MVATTSRTEPQVSVRCRPSERWTTLARSRPSSHHALITMTIGSSVARVPLNPRTGQASPRAVADPSIPHVQGVMRLTRH